MATRAERRADAHAAQERRAKRNAARKAEGGTTRWEQARAERRLRRVAVSEQPRNPRGLIVKHIGGHEVLVFDTDKARLRALVALSQESEAKVADAFAKDQARKKARQRKPAPKPGKVTTRVKEDAK